MSSDEGMPEMELDPRIIEPTEEDYEEDTRQWKERQERKAEILEQIRALMNKIDRDEVLNLFNTAELELELNVRKLME